MTWLWQPLLPGGAQLLSGGAVSDTTAIDTGTYTVTMVDATFIVSQVTAVNTGSYVVTFNDATFVAVGDVPAPDAAVVYGGWSWPVEHAHKRKKHREPFDGLREEIEAIYRRVTGQEPAPAEIAEAAKDVAAVVEPYVVENRIDWRKALRAKQFEYRLAIAAEAYEAALRQAIEDEEDEDWLLLAA